MSVSDTHIKEEWGDAVRYYKTGSRLGQLIAFKIADDLEASGVTENDICRLFPSALPPKTTGSEKALGKVADG